MLRLQQLEQDLRQDIEERQRLTSSNRRLGEEQKRAAARRRHKERKAHRREHNEMPDTTWKFTDNAQVASTQAAARAAQKRQLDAQRQAQREFAATLSLSARHQSTKLGMTGNRAPPKQHPVFFPGPKDIIRGKIVPPDAAEAAYREAYERHEREMQRKLDLARRKEAEVAREAERQDMEYMRRVRGGHTAVMRSAMVCHLPPYARGVRSLHTTRRHGLASTEGGAAARTA